MLENFQGDSWGLIPPLRMSSLLPHDLCHGWRSSRRLPTEKTKIFLLNNINVHWVTRILHLFNCSVVPDSLHTRGMYHASLPCLSLSPGACSNSCPLSWWCYPSIPLSITPFSSCPQFFPALGSFPMSQLFAPGCQSIRGSASASVLPMSIQGWFPSRLTGLISLLSKGPSKVFSSIRVWKHQFFGAQPSLWCNSHLHTWLLEKP